MVSVSKKPRSFTVDEEVDEKLRRRQDVNASGLVNQFLKEYLDTSDENYAESMVRQLKREIREIDSDIEDLQAKRTRKVNDLQEWKEKRDKKHAEQREKAMEKVKGAPADPDLACVQVAADMLGITAKEMAEKMEQER